MEATVVTKRATYRAHHEDMSMYNNIDPMVDKLKRQVVDDKEKHTRK